GEGVEIVRVLEAPRVSVGASGLRVELPDMIVGEERNIVVELRVRTSDKLGPVRALNATFQGREAGRARLFRYAQPAETFCAEQDARGTDPAAHAVVSVTLAAEMRGKARALSDRGSFADAEATLREAQALLAATPGFVEGDGSALADAYETLADEIRVM